MTPSPFGSHQKLLARLSQRLLNALDAIGCRDCEVLLELDWVVSDDTVVRPDVSVVCGTSVERFIEHPPRLIIEVLSESTARKDRTIKFDLYQRQKVKYYIMLEPQQTETTAYQLNDHGVYELIDKAGRIPLQLHPHCVIELDLAF